MAVNWTSVVMIVVALFVIMRSLPLQPAIRAMGGWLQSLGGWGMLVYGVIYALTTLLLMPGSVLTLAAGVIFGPLWGTITVSLASTTGAALAFLVARYAAREAVARKVRRYPKFDAVDRAIAEGGWKVVAMLRLSPAVPFNLQNYLYGLTAVRFWPAVITSWIAMLPGTFMYVYLGYTGREAVAAAATGTVNVGRWILLTVGLIATVVLTVYITKLARNKMKEQTSLVVEGPASPPATEDTPAASKERTRPVISAVILPMAAIAMVALAACSYAWQGRLASLFGPPAVAMVEAYDERPGGPTLDHSVYNELVKRYVDDAGWVDYRGLMKGRAKLKEYIAAIEKAPFKKLGRNEKLALLINAYNAFTLELILEYWNDGQLESIRDIPAAERWDHQRWNIGGNVWSLNQIEHEQIRPKFREPRIHFALVCAAVGCPPLRNEAYVADRLDDQLEDQTAYVHTHDRWFRFQPESGVVYLTALYNWYGSDFEQVADSILHYAARYVPALRKALEAGRRLDIQWLDYDWDLNAKKNKPNG